MGYTSSYDNDKIVGIVMIVLSLCGVCLGSLLTGIGSLIGLGSAGAGVLPGAVVGGGLAIVGGVILIAGILNIAAGVGIMKSARWGFILGGIMSAISVLAVVADLSGWSLLSFAANAAFVVYCFMRLTGRLGPTPR